MQVHTQRITPHTQLSELLEANLVFSCLSAFSLVAELRLTHGNRIKVDKLSNFFQCGNGKAAQKKHRGSAPANQSADPRLHLGACCPGALCCVFAARRKKGEERQAPQILLRLNQVLDRSSGIEHPTIGSDDTTEGREVVLKSEVVGALEADWTREADPVGRHVSEDHALEAGGSQWLRRIDANGMTESIAWGLVQEKYLS